MKPSILIVDDEKNTREGLRKALESPAYGILLAANSAEALGILALGKVDLVLTDLRMPGESGLDLMRKSRALRYEAVFILLTAYGTVQTAVQAMKEGAYDYLTKPVNLDELGMVVNRALAARPPGGETPGEAQGFDALIGRSGAVEEIKDMVRQIAPTKATVLIEGESGTGKELIARAIHDRSDRSAQPFIAVHCAALAEGVLESELFGHERGAFTGAFKRHLGRFEMSDRGTLFLDEVSEMGAGTQVKLLRVLQEQAFDRVGGTETIRVDVRVIAATNAPLEKLMREGRFREDLYYRLNVIRLKVLPLRERKEDIPLLAAEFLKEFNAANGRRISGIAPAALSALAAYEWPGNVRELRNCVEGLVVLCRGNEIAFSDLPGKLREGAPEPGPVDAAGAAPAGAATLKDAERRMIEEALANAGGSRTEAAKALGISRRTLHRKINLYGL
ncbi:MAG: sigma-54 dependent transcriptional regulator [Chlamydiota bacterium]